MHPTFQPAPEQLNIFAHVRQQRGNLIISACAGGGKTTTLCHLLDHIPRNPASLIPPAVVFLSFGASIVATLQKRVPFWCLCSTFHKLGLRALKEKFPNIKLTGVNGIPPKVGRLVWPLCDRDDPDAALIIRAVGLLKSTWPTVERSSIATWLADVHSLDFASPASLDKVSRVFDRSLADTETCDFDDMLLLPLAHNCPFEKKDWVLVDEVQDTNDVQLAILERLQLPWVSNRPDEQYSRTTFIFVGDPHQAIYAFRGANSDSMSRIASRFSCATLPLSVSYRCPQLHVKEAQKYV